MENYLELQENFEKWFKSHCGNLVDKTKEQYLFVITSFIKYLISFQAFEINEISPKIFNQFLYVKPSGKSYSASSVIQRIAALDIFFSWANENNFVRSDNNPVMYYKKNKIQPRNFLKKDKNNLVTVLSDQEQKKLIRSLGRADNFFTARNNCIVLLILSTGLFAEEITNLRKNSVCLKERTLIIKKSNHKTRKAIINLDISQKACERWINFSKAHPKNKKVPLFFFNRGGRKIKTNRLYGIVLKTLLKAGLKKKQMGPDLLRQTAILNMLKKG